MSVAAQTTNLYARTRSAERGGMTDTSKATGGQAGDLPGSRNTADATTVCPFCGGHVARVEVTDSSGERAYSLCCGIPQEFLDNWDVFRDLPEPLQQPCHRDLRHAQPREEGLPERHRRQKPSELLRQRT